MADRYLKTDGDDGENGATLALAWDTWDHAIGATGIQDGETGDASDGTYQEATGAFDYLRATTGYTSETIWAAATEGSTGVIVTTSGDNTPTNPITYNADFIGTDYLTLIDITFRLTQNVADKPNANVRLSAAPEHIKFIRCHFEKGSQTQAHSGCICTAAGGTDLQFIDCDFEASTGAKQGLYVYGTSGNVCDGVIVRNCTTSGGSYGLRLHYVANAKVYGGQFAAEGTQTGTALFCGNDNPATNEELDGLEIYGAQFSHSGTTKHCGLLGGGCNDAVLEGCTFEGGNYAFVDKSDGSTIRSCLFEGGTDATVLFKGTNSRVGTAEVYDNCTIRQTNAAIAVRTQLSGTDQTTNVTFTNCIVGAASGQSCFGWTTGDWDNVAFNNGVYGATEGTNAPAITNSVNAVPEIDAMSIPTKGGNCDVGKGVVGKRTLGQLDLYGRPVLRADADSIGAVYPQRADPRNILRPIVQYASEAAA